MSLCLSRDELTELCRTPQKARQLAFLRKNGIRHYVDAYGRPVVTRAAVEGTPEPKPAAPAWRPNKAID
ncbi:MAG: DUF4224 domain-containing protein [Dyella sp.]|uniref:DUF4224 domain-containing protein n=1 Tax=Dyella sp. TaxID=1869338 RepID=UPI003F7DB40A